MTTKKTKKKQKQKQEKKTIYLLFDCEIKSIQRIQECYFESISTSYYLNSIKIINNQQQKTKNNNNKNKSHWFLFLLLSQNLS